MVVPENARLPNPRNSMNRSAAESLATSVVESFGPQMARAIEDELRRGWHMEAMTAAVRQKQIAQANPIRRTVEGVGQAMMSVDPIAYHYWGGRLGYQCWRDRQFVREFLRDNPDARVRTQAKSNRIVRP